MSAYHTQLPAFSNKHIVPHPTKNLSYSIKNRNEKQLAYLEKDASLAWLPWLLLKLTSNDDEYEEEGEGKQALL